MAIAELTDSQRIEAMSELPGWTLRADKKAIERDFSFRNFSEAWAFMARVALLAEKLDHHPEWFNVYGRVEIVLTTHFVNGLSERDIAMARAIDEIR